MKKITVRCALLTLLLVVSVAGTAFAAAEITEEPEQYIHPEAGYGFNMPVGWYAIDSAGLRYVTEDSREMALEVVRQTEDLESLVQNMPAVFLFPGDGTGMDFMSNINVNVSDTGTPIDMDTLLSMVEEQLESQYKEMYPDYESLRPPFVVEFRGHEVCVHGGAYSIWGTVMEMHQIYMLEGTSLYTITIVAPMDDLFEEFQLVAADIIESFVMP